MSGVEDWAMAEIARLTRERDMALDMHRVQFERANRLHELAEDRLVMIEDVEAVALKARHTPTANDPYRVAIDIADEIDAAIEVDQ